MKAELSLNRNNENDLFAACVEQEREVCGAHEVEGDDFVVGLRRLPGDHARALQVLDAEPVLVSDDGLDPVARLAVLFHQLALHRVHRRHLLVVLRRQVQVLEALKAETEETPLLIALRQTMYGD